ncbi:uncharacterized protein PV09_05174 [Verruconis gallopava]|uniref:LDB19 N-terminal domain-containing protein n=1 Tax=Verruconis gallopava TaxID=253628 RepID=A0A0D2AXH3_9PEZI|nr:uncharacterized protein PV09_05174 [Verruconis gallopava]KIW03879.1 hypothetical protein PV09_05174 [Verruconis gallopava]
MPLLGFVARRSSHTRDGASIKDQLRKVAAKGPSTSTLSVQSGLLGHVEDMHHMDAAKRHSIGGKLMPDRRSSANAQKVALSKPAKLWLTVESPPLVAYNIPANSTGALFSAQLHVDVTDSELTFESVEARFICVTTVKRPVHPHCPECSTKVTELKKINLAKEGLRLRRGDHPIPISYLFPGHLPATTRGTLVSVEYFLVAQAKTVTGETIGLCQRTSDGRFTPLPNDRFEIKLSRSILPGNEKHSIRIFPPTNLTASVTLNPVIHPIGEFEVSLRLSGMTEKKKDAINRWRLRKMNWRIEETQRMISPACPKHAEKIGGQGRGIKHEDVRTIGEGEIDQRRNPWKNNLDAGDVEAIFYASVNPNKKPVCDAEANNGMSITHNLVVEMVVAEEWCPRNKPNQVTPTGAARILRTQFHLMLTERPGLGVSWDEETPPVYEDVPESPPHYASMTDFDMNVLGGQIEELHLDPNTQQLLSTGASSSGTRSPPRSRSTERGPQSARAHFVYSADDLLSGPPERRDSEPQEEEEDDVQIADAAHMNRT